MAEVEVQLLEACLNLKKALPRSNVKKREGEMIATDEAVATDKILVQHMKIFQNLIYLVGNFFRYHDTNILIPVNAKILSYSLHTAKIKSIHISYTRPMNGQSVVLQGVRSSRLSIKLNFSFRTGVSFAC